VALILIGVNHRTAPVDVRERMSVADAQLGETLGQLKSVAAVDGVALLSTCNRVEIIVSAESEDVIEPFVDWLVARGDSSRSELEKHLYILRYDDVVRHLFRVAAGLDSLVVGEPQVLGQVKEAHAAAAELRAAGPTLNRLFHASFAVGKRVRTETQLGAGAVSVGFAAVALARKIFGNLKDRAVLVVGAGEMGKLTAMHLKSQGVLRVTIVSRTMAHAARTARTIGGSAAPWDELDATLEASDIVITATGAASPIFTKAHVESLMRGRRDRPLFIVDIAVPRDVEPAAGEIEQVFLYNVDDLQATVRENLARRGSEVERAEAIVGEETEKFAAWLRSRSAIPTVVALRQRFEAIRRAELERLEFKLSALPPEARSRVDEITHLIIEKLLLMPTEQLKALGDGETVDAYAEALTRLFGLGDQALGEGDDARAKTGRVEPFPRSGSRVQR